MHSENREEWGKHTDREYYYYLVKSWEMHDVFLHLSTIIIFFQESCCFIAGNSWEKKKKHVKFHTRKGH